MMIADLATMLFDFVFGWFLPFIAVLTVVVFFHELGHFLVARWNGVTVQAFAVGFGPELFGFDDRHGTRWKLCAVPLGGYVKFLGDADGSSRPDHEALAELSVVDSAGAFENAALWRRALIVAAGPIANFILAIVIYTALFLHLPDVRVPPVVGTVVEGSAAQEAGVRVGDRITAIDGSPVTRFTDIQRVTTLSSDEPLVFTIDRDGRTIEMTISPRMTEREDPFGNKYKSGLIGVGPDRSPDSIERVELGLLEAVAKAGDRVVMIIEATFGFIGDLIFGKQDARELRGPLGIADMTSQVATLGVLELISMAALLSVSIGLMNLFPIPVLDGGHLVLYALEALRGRALSERSQEMVFRGGLACVLGLMLFATSNDVLRYVERWFG